jgi:hypothetical protein
MHGFWGVWADVIPAWVQLRTWFSLIAGFASVFPEI